MGAFAGEPVALAGVLRPLLEALVCAATCVAEVLELEVTAATPCAELEVVGLKAEGCAPAWAWSVAKRFCIKVLKL